MELSIYKNFLVIFCILVKCSALAVEAKSELESISELQDYFGEEVNRIEKKYEIAMKSKKQLKRDIYQFNMELNKERIQTSREITKLQENFKSVENQLIKEITDLKTEFANSRKEHKTEIYHMKKELITTRRDLELKMTHCQQKPVAEGNDYSPVSLAANEPLILGNDQADSIVSETRRIEKEHTSKASPDLFDIQVKTGKTGIKRQTSFYRGRVAFFARLSQTTVALNISQALTFDHVVTNVGSGYHNSTGTFTAPVPGVYVFTTSILAYGPSSHHVNVVKNGQLLAKIDFNDADSYDDSSQTVVVELDKGDVIAVQNADYTGMVYHGDFYSTFSGFLLYEYEDASEIVGK